MYTPIEYPKSLYLAGNAEFDHVIVLNLEGENEWRKLGYRMSGESVQEKEQVKAEPTNVEPAKRKPGRPRKEQ